MKRKISNGSRGILGQAQPNYLVPMGYLLAVVATIIWAGNFIIARSFNEDILPVGLAFWRWTIAVITLTPFALRVTVEDWKLVKKHLPYLAVSALSGVTVFNTLIYIAGHTTQAMNLSLIAASSPIFIVLMSRLFYGEVISLTRATGIIVVVIGVLLLITGGSLERLLSISFAIGDLYMLLAAIIFAGYTMLVKRKPPAMRMITFNLCTFSLGLLFLAPFYGLECWIYHPVVLNLSIMLALLYVGILSSVVAFLAWNKAIIIIGPSRTALIYYLIPVFSGIAAWLIIGEEISLVHIFSMSIIISGIIITNRTTS
ncbi:DMT family transporter [Limnofasciculus baicalensis]|uniref:DMT family transporter n=1 Tax=Limnofasciculus baicalensis BBK-W-15 TaxID=2699891 RepID=A0AAE3GUF0_9CYAN|nr:DMT family transporter [Limnofasciculus baicalensis]MCP2729963.1 DMT family transporter [Limnofasciculus baicalensis BBK-W-15]